jgi:hypothetical protein
MTGFFDFPVEVRHMIYMNLISTETPLDLWQPFPSEWLHVDLFYTSRIISLEYRALVYSKISFDLTTHSTAHTAKFLDQIGENANYIRHVHIRFPKVLENGDSLFISEQSAQILDKIQNACTGLTKVTFGPVCAFDGRVSPYLESPEKTSNLFSLVNDRLQAFPSLWSITVAIPASDAYRPISDELKHRYGWNVIEEEDWSQDGWSPRRINRNGNNGRSNQSASGVLSGIGVNNRPLPQNNVDGEMDDSSGSSDDTREDGHDRNTGGVDSGSDDESIQDDGSSNTTVNTENTGDGLDNDGSDDGFDWNESQLYERYQQLFEDSLGAGMDNI